MANDNVLCIVMRGRELIEKGWCRSSYRQFNGCGVSRADSIRLIAEGQTVDFCAVGALDHAYEELGRDGLLENRQAMVEAELAIRTANGLLERPVGCRGLESFNDSHDQADVLHAFDATIAFLTGDVE